MNEERLIERIEDDLKQQKEAGRLKFENLGSDWSARMLKEPSRFIEGEFKLKADAMRNFRRARVFLPDVPVGRQSAFNIFNLIDGTRRGHTKMLKDALKVIEENGFAPLLKKYPCWRSGNPNVFSYKGYEFTFEWLRHIYFLGLFKKHIYPRLTDEFTQLDSKHLTGVTTLDLGCFYGTFAGLLKKEFGNSHCVLVDLPQQLSLAHYYLGSNMPDAAIATYKEIKDIRSIDRDFINKYDFILVPFYLYEKIAEASIDVFTNFMSLQEMGRKYFDFYLTNEPFLSARYFLTVNRYSASPTYDNGVTILDYPLSGFKRLHFGTSPIVGERYRRKWLFFYTYFPYASQHFEFVGKRYVF